MNKKLTIVPVNGLINRMQAIASSYILADYLNFNLEIFWQSDHTCSTIPSDIFSNKFIKKFFRNDSTFLKILCKNNYSLIPKYLNINPKYKLITLRGNDKGEQRFIKNLITLVLQNQNITNIVIVAGSKFTNLPPEQFISARQKFYRGEIWNHEIKKIITTPKFEYIGLHIRKTDRSYDAPTTYQIKKTIRNYSTIFKINKVFLSADNKKDLLKWRSILSKNGFFYFDNNTTEFSRKKNKSGVFAIQDWLVLADSKVMIYHKNSSFGQEASILNSNFKQSIGLEASQIIKIIRTIRFRYLYNYVIRMALKLRIQFIFSIAKKIFS